MAVGVDLVRRLYSVPPDVQTRLDNNPTLLVSWWATGFALVIIFVRVIGRAVRTERLFADDWTMLLSVIPLLVRMGFIHVILLFGTNNAFPQDDAHLFDAEEIRLREIGSRLVLPARIFYALFIWTAKLAVADFLGRITAQIWRSSFRYVLQFIRYFLAITFAGVVVATLAECQPFSHYWQVVPDPGPKCRQGYGQLITMGVCDVITDLMLVIFPIPIIHLSVMPIKRKIWLWILFAMSLILVAITCFRVPSVIERHGSQQYRSLIASLEILAAATVSNAVVIGSFVRDRGVKKHKFKIEKSVSLGESVGQGSSSRRATTVTQHHWGSDSDLARDLGMRLDPENHHPASYEKIRPAPRAVIAHSANRGPIDPNWQFSSAPSSYPPRPGEEAPEDDAASSTGSLGADRAHPREYPSTSAPQPPSKISLSDVGGVLEPPSPKTRSSPRISPKTTITSPPAPSAAAADKILQPSRSRTSSQTQTPQSSPSSPTPPRDWPYATTSDAPYMSGGRINAPPVPELLDPGGLLKPNRHRR